MCHIWSTTFSHSEVECLWIFMDGCKSHTSDELTIYGQQEEQHSDIDILGSRRESHEWRVPLSFWDLNPMGPQWPYMVDDNYPSVYCLTFCDDIWLCLSEHIFPYMVYRTLYVLERFLTVLFTAGKVAPLVLLTSAYLTSGCISAKNEAVHVKLSQKLRLTMFNLRYDLPTQCIRKKWIAVNCRGLLSDFTLFLV